MSIWLLAQAAAEGVDVGAPLVFGGGVMLFMFLLGLVALAIWIWALVDAIRNPGLSNNEKLIWVLVILLTNTIGALIYLLIGRSRRAMST